MRGKKAAIKPDKRSRSVDAPESWYATGAPDAPVAWYGGKMYYARWIIERFASHRVYVEPFGGAANVLLRKVKSQVEVYNDLDSRIVNFFRILRDQDKFAEFQRMCALTPYAREEFVRLIDVAEPQDDIERAWWFFVRCRQALGGLGMSKLTPNSWSASIRTRRNLPEGVSKYLSAIEGLENIVTRFREVMVECRPAIEMFRKYDSAETLFYVDPPYLPETRHAGLAATYGVEMKREDHQNLLDAIKSLKGKVLLSGYDSDLYSKALKSWNRAELVGKSHLTNSGQTRVEVLWMNY
jgi:DNA adenine methylase